MHVSFPRNLLQMLMWNFGRNAPYALSKRSRMGSPFEGQYDLPKGEQSQLGKATLGQPHDVLRCILSVSAEGLYFTAMVSLERYISCLVYHNHEIGLLKA